MANEHRAKMTKEEAIHILMRLGEYVVHDEDFGIMIKAPLMDACAMAIKAIKAPEVVHGRWDWKRIDERTEQLYCSVCGSDSGACETYNYCPNCGALMDGERKDDERKAD